MRRQSDTRWWSTACPRSRSTVASGPTAVWRPPPQSHSPQPALALTLIAGQAALQVELHPDSVVPLLHIVHALPLAHAAVRRSGKMFQAEASPSDSVQQAGSLIGEQPGAPWLAEAPLGSPLPGPGQQFAVGALHRPLVELLPASKCDVVIMPGAPQAGLPAGQLLDVSQRKRAAGVEAHAVQAVQLALVLQHRHVAALHVCAHAQSGSAAAVCRASERTCGMAAPRQPLTQNRHGVLHHCSPRYACPMSTLPRPAREACHPRCSPRVGPDKPRARLPGPPPQSPLPRCTRRVGGAPGRFEHFSRLSGSFNGVSGFAYTVFGITVGFKRR